ncbi:PREDICTED: glyceraldehyde-3-phosphate dehydrogenase, testis-specific-like [Lupinus angustifolius]|uniref:glyceraldehyde-3-phosphate dehydrogenase, testis-specific-like n=1 Tax=Lupinus angustifolius TaxID=3871 RepID=UPI00092F57BE|nr:PREDICTED: glyceraldehyde-3-phosphate dehydrogenase, testis-specific-like [Lupinus angustifolius]
MAFTHSFYPPPPPSFRPPHPPPSHPLSPPPPPPHLYPPPSPFHPIVPPPHVFPPPAPVPVPPSPSPNNHPIVIVVVFVSLGGLVLLSLLTFALCCSIKKSKEKKTRETDIIRVDEHKEIKETIVTDPFGKQAVVLSVEDDVHIEEEIGKNEEKVGHSLHAESHQEMDIIHVDEHKKIKETIVADPFGQKEVVLSIQDDLHIEEEKTKNYEKFDQNLHATEDQGNSSSTIVGTTSSDHEHQQIENKV